MRREKTIAPFPTPAVRNCFRYNGFLLHANTRIAPKDRKGLEKLVKYLLRPAVSADRLEVVDAHRIWLTLKTRWKDGTTAVVYQANAFIQRLAAQVPLQRRPMWHYDGVFAPNAASRRAIVPGAWRHRRRSACGGLELLAPARIATKLHWSEALRRAFAIDLLRCPCGGQRKVPALVQSERECARTLGHLGLPAVACEIEQARGPPEAFELPADDDFGDRPLPNDDHDFAA